MQTLRRPFCRAPDFADKQTSSQANFLEMQTYSTSESPRRNAGSHDGHTSSGAGYIGDSAGLFASGGQPTRTSSRMWCAIIILLSAATSTTTASSRAHAPTPSCSTAGAWAPGLLPSQLRASAPTLTLRGGGKSSEKKARVDKKKKGKGDKQEKKRARDEDNPMDTKRAREGTAISKLKLMSEDSDDGGADDSGDAEDDSVDELEYETAPQDGEFGGALGAHALGTVPVAAGPQLISKDAAGGHGEDSTSESYPGCYVDDSDDVEEEEHIVERTEPLPTRDELMQRIRDRPFNQSLVRPIPHMCARIVATYMNPQFSTHISANPPLHCDS